MGESALLLSWGNRISRPLNGHIHNVTRKLRVSLLPGVYDLVPSYASLLVVFESQGSNTSDLNRWLGEGFANVKGADDDHKQTPQQHRVPVQYGGAAGPDLEELAAMTGCTPREIVRAHTMRPFYVAFLGFLPGFAYMGRWPHHNAVPRLATPRARVPAGSVGLAGFQTGIYPFSSPGGWRIIGRTGLRVWDPSSPEPARFAPGDTARFVQSNYEPMHPSYVPSVGRPTRPTLEVVQAAGVCSIQDLGRRGLMHLGVGTGGAFDIHAVQRANALVGNEPGAAVLEMVMGAPALRVLRNVTIALDGADFRCRADDTLVPVGLSWFVRAGTLLTFTPSGDPTTCGVRAYLGVAGGVDVPSVLGSKSTSLLAHFGGLEGRILRTGDVLGVGEMHAPPAAMAGRFWSGHVRDISRKDTELRFVPFEGLQAAPRQALRQFVAHMWIVSEQADRMGLRLRSPEGLRLPTMQRELASFGVVPGSIQLPSGGEPVVLGPDCQTTGGYPLLGVVIEADMAVLAQATPGAELRFTPVGLREACALGAVSRSELEHGLRMLAR